jgi:hypothetical protein
VVEEPSILGDLRLIEIEHASTEEVLIGTNTESGRPCVPGWDVLRTIGGEIAEISTLAQAEAFESGHPVLLTGRFEKQGLFRVTLLPVQERATFRIRVIGTRGDAELYFPAGRPGPGFLMWREGNESHEQSWDAWDPWPRVVEVLEAAVVSHDKKRTPPGVSVLSWQDEIRSLELDDGARRSVQKRRVSQMEYPEASEEVTFKGTMTLVGCALLWAVILLVILFYKSPWVGWVVGGVLAVFLALQLLRGIIPSREDQKETRP